MLGRWPVGSYEEQEESRGGRCTEATLGLLQKCENGCEDEDQEREEGIEKLNSEREQGGMSYKLFSTDVKERGSGEG